MAYFFKLPIITDLTIPQQFVLNETKAISISGGPGTGKSVVSLWRHIQNYDLQRRKSLLLTYTITLERYFSLALKSPSLNVKEETKKLASQATNRTLYWTYHNINHNYDEIIIDEAQDVILAKYELISGYCKMVSYGIDPNQSMHLNPVQLKELVNGLTTLFPNNVRIPPLNENFRNSFEVTQFVRSLFPNRIFPSGQFNGPKPILICTNNNNSLQHQAIFDIISEFQSDTHNIAILLPLANPALHRQTVVRDYYNLINQKGIKCSYYENENGQLLQIENIHITTLKSAKGLEFDTVIIPDFQHFKTDIQQLRVVEESDYYVTFTRAKRNLILIDNGNTDSNNKCNLDFLKPQIIKNIITVDYDYITNDKNSDSETDDLPF
jgi:superfamily I DNA/RNA helicase